MEIGAFEIYSGRVQKIRSGAERGGVMKKSELEKYIGKNVEVTLDDDTSYRGILSKTEENLKRYVKAKYYFCKGFEDNTIFRSSHVKKVREL